MGGTIVAVILGFVMFRLNIFAQKVMSFLKLEQRSSHGTIMATSLLGVYSHILLDAPLYTDIRPFYPLDVNPFLDIDVSLGVSVFSFCALCFLLGVAIYVVRLFPRR